MLFERKTIVEQLALGNGYPTHIESASEANFLSPMPDTRLRSSIAANAPFAFRSSTMRCANAGPTPLSCCNSSAVALLMLTLPGAAEEVFAEATDGSMP